MNEPKKNDIKRILIALKKTSLKYVPLDKLARLVGLYADIISDELVYFEPMIKFDPMINTKDLLPQLEAYMAETEEPKKKKAAPSKRVVATKKQLAEFASIQDFVYKKMTNAGGLVDRSNALSDEDLHILKKLVDAETSARRKAKKAKKK